ncbi:MAG TPA: class I SAM-dependent methyltransferase [Flavilitoribacter sp.]|nr:class I SAM-dependent methyltransferase [Flavilitoribacter sp.]HMQ88475.1 class I SAM-dependent methyltransferase [Flavilitoribacter sp.]
MQKISNKNAYNKIAGQWAENRRRSFVSRLVTDFGARLAPGARILDLGCGCGIPNAEYMSQRGFSVTGIDAAAEMIRIAEGLQLPNARFEVCDILEYDGGEPFDAILAWDSLFHLPYAAQAGIFRKIGKWLNAGGLFLFSHSGVDGEITGEMFGESFYYSGLSTDAVRRVLAEAGFEIEMLAEDYRERDTHKGLVVLARLKRDDVAGPVRLL